MRIVSDDQLAAMNLWMEARGEPFEGLVAVGEVVRNRMKQAKYDLNKDKVTSATEVVLAPYQFSGWNTTDPGRWKALTLDDQDPGYQRALKAWEMSKTTDMTKGATMYYAPETLKKLGYKQPSWAVPEKFVIQIGNHHFYRE